MARRRDDDEDDDDRPRSRRRREEDEADDEPRPKRKPRLVEDDEDDDDRPRRRTEKAGGMSKGLLFGLIGGGAALVLLVVLLIFFLGGGGGVKDTPRDGVGATDTPRAVFEAHVKDLKSGNKERAYQAISARVRRDMERSAARDGGRPEDECFEFASDSPWVKYPSTISKEEISPDGMKATLTVTWSAPARQKTKDDFGPPKMSFEARLLKEEGSWKIDN